MVLHAPWAAVAPLVLLLAREGAAAAAAGQPVQNVLASELELARHDLPHFDLKGLQRYVRTPPGGSTELVAAAGPDLTPETPVGWIKAPKVLPAAGKPHGANASAANTELWRIFAVDGALGGADDWYVGVLLESFGQLINVAGKHMWRYIGKRHEVATRGEFWIYTIAGTICVLVYVVADVLALQFTAQSIVSSCDGMAIFWNNVLAPFTLKERFTTGQLVACIFIVSGTVGAALSGTHATGQPVSYYLTLMREGPAIGYYVATTLLVCFMSYILWQRCAAPRIVHQNRSPSFRLRCALPTSPRPVYPATACRGQPLPTYPATARHRSAYHATAC